jgi:hypothetical protein
MSQDPHSKPENPAQSHGNPDAHSDLEDYAGGYIQAHHGTIPAWLLLVYLILFIFALFYMVFYWGGLGPGLGY